MKQINFKNFDGHFFVEEFDKGEEQGRAKIYDEYNEYFDYIDTDSITEEEYNNEIELLENIKDSHEFTDYFWQSYDFGNSLQCIVDSMNEENYNSAESEELAEEMANGYADDLANLTEQEFCEHYDINKIGTMYFRGNF